MNIPALRAAALAATPESLLTRHDYDHGGGRVCVDREADRKLVMDVYDAENRAYYAMVNPQAVIAMCDTMERMTALLGRLVDDEPCSLDHNGACQTHSAFDGPCAVAETRKFLAALLAGKT